jgi:tetratricopeptide (TPR) repeat protein
MKATLVGERATSIYRICFFILMLLLCDFIHPWDFSHRVQLWGAFKRNVTMIPTVVDLISLGRSIALGDLAPPPYDRQEVANRDLRPQIQVTLTQATDTKLKRAGDAYLLLHGKQMEIATPPETVGTDPVWLLILAVADGKNHRYDSAKELLRKVPLAASGLQVHATYIWFQCGGAGPELNRVILLLEMAKEFYSLRKREEVQVYRILSIAYERTGRRREAIENAGSWFRLAPRDFHSSTWLAGLYLWDGKPEDAYQVLVAAQGEMGSNYPNFAGEMGQIYESRGDLAKAIQEYRVQLAESPSDPYRYWYLASALHRTGLNAEAEQYLKLLLDLRDAPPALIQNARSLLRELTLENRSR